MKTKGIFITYLLIVIIALAITVVPVFAQSPTPTPTDTAPTIALPGTFTGFLQLLGSAIFIGPAISILAKKWTWFQGLSKSAKFGMVFAICMILPLGSHALLTYLSPGVIAVIEILVALCTGRFWGVYRNANLVGSVWG